MEEIKHTGIVVSAGPDAVKVRFEQNSACAGCHAAGYCTATSSEERIMEVKGNHELRSGDRVEVSISKSQGYLALFLGYLLPLLILLTVLFILTGLSAGEVTAALAAVGVTGIYYLGLYLSGKHISGKFNFRVHKI
ncbi:MAG TPA: SoxR reducing system RseC family protein [Bacteroidales bacterium]|nr:SoxR reducing system RseC family protein [Bacteroidales bacterium]HRT89160.1 SoxR reducing system RseC family protein [Bacteroidales bacterium]